MNWLGKSLKELFFMVGLMVCMMVIVEILEDHVYLTNLWAFWFGYIFANIMVWYRRGM